MEASRVAAQDEPAALIGRGGNPRKRGCFYGSAVVLSGSIRRLRSGDLGYLHQGSPPGLIHR